MNRIYLDCERLSLQMLGGNEAAKLMDKYDVKYETIKEFLLQGFTANEIEKIFDAILVLGSKVQNEQILEHIGMIDRFLRTAESAISDSLAIINKNIKSIK